MNRLHSGNEEEPPSGKRKSNASPSPSPSPIAIADARQKSQLKTVNLLESSCNSRQSSLAPIGTDLMPIKVLGGRSDAGKIVRLRTTPRTSSRTVEFRRRYFPQVSEKE